MGYHPMSVRQMDFSRLIEKTPEQKAEAERIAEQIRLKEAAHKILADQKAAADAAAAAEREAARQHQRQRVQLLAEEALLRTATRSEQLECIRRVNAESLIGKSDYDVCAAYSDALHDVRTEREN
jgi:hypothetical protein